MNHIFVALRPKPQSSPTQAENPETKENSYWKLSSSSQPTVTDIQTRKYYELDHLFNEESTNQEVFEKLILEPILASQGGANLNIMAYGQTASGKTHTIYGTPNDPGLLNQSIDLSFREMRKNLRIFHLKISYLEVYNEQVNDLLDPSRSNLEIREQPKHGICVHRLSEAIVSSEAEVFQLLHNGSLNRSIGKTKMNKFSSRSHTILKILFETVDRQAQKLSLMSFIDLAGSESVQNIKEQNIEGANIKKSLLSLSLVIKTLRIGQKDAHFRQSKLTRLLQPLLCSRAITVIVCTVNLNNVHYQETKKTLQFGCNARNIKKEILIEEAKVSQELEVSAQESQIFRTMEQELKNKESGEVALKKLLEDKDMVLEALMKEFEEAKKNFTRELDEQKNKIVNLARAVEESKKNEAAMAIELEEARRKSIWLEGLVETFLLQVSPVRHQNFQADPQNIVLPLVQPLNSSEFQSHLENNENGNEAEIKISDVGVQVEEELPEIEENLSQLFIHMEMKPELDYNQMDEVMQPQICMPLPFMQEVGDSRRKFNQDKVRLDLDTFTLLKGFIRIEELSEESKKLLSLNFENLKRVFNFTPKSQDGYAEVFCHLVTASRWFPDEVLIKKPGCKTKISQKKAHWKNKLVSQYRLMPPSPSSLSNSELHYKKEPKSKWLQIPYQADLERIANETHFKENHCDAHDINNIILDSYFCFGFKEVAQTAVSNCQLCLLRKTLNNNEIEIPLQIIKSTKPLEKVNIFIFKPAFLISDYKYLVTAKDQFSRLAFAKPLTNRNSLETAKALEDFIQLWGRPYSIKTGYQKEFSGEFKEFVEGMEIRHIQEKSFLSKKQKSIENFNGYFKSELKKFKNNAEGEFNIIRAIEQIIDFYNQDRKHSTTGMKPLELFRCNDQHILEEVYSKVQKAHEQKQSNRFLPQHVAILNTFIISADDTLKFMQVKERDAVAIGIVKGRAFNGFVIVEVTKIYKPSNPLREKESFAIEPKVLRELGLDDYRRLSGTSPLKRRREQD